MFAIFSIKFFFRLYDTVDLADIFLDITYNERKANVSSLDSSHGVMRSCHMYTTRLVINTTQRVKIMSNPAVYFRLSTMRPAASALVVSLE